MAGVRTLSFEDDDEIGIPSSTCKNTAQVKQMHEFHCPDGLSKLDERVDKHGKQIDILDCLPPP